MKVWLVRHAKAADAASFSGADIERPLVKEGRRRAARCFAFLAERMKGPDLVVSSEALRAEETADLLAEAFPEAHRTRDARLNPGAAPEDGLAVVREAANIDPSVLVALVGHEPDLSDMLSAWTASGALDVAFKKNAVAEVALDVETGRGSLSWLATPAWWKTDT